MPTVNQHVVTLKREIFDYVDNPEGGATVNDRESMQVLHRLKKLVKTVPYPRVVLICDYRHVEHILGCMHMRSGDLGNRLEMWHKVFNNRSVDPKEVAQRMAAHQPGSYFIFPEHVAKKLGFRQELLQPGIHLMPLQYMGREDEDEIPTLKCATAADLAQFDANREDPTVQISTSEPAYSTSAEPEKDSQPEVAKSFNWLWLILSYLAGAATSAVLLKTVL